MGNDRSFAIQAHVGSLPFIASLNQVLHRTRETLTFNVWVIIFALIDGVNRSTPNLYSTLLCMKFRFLSFLLFCFLSSRSREEVVLFVTSITVKLVLCVVFNRKGGDNNHATYVAGTTEVLCNTAVTPVIIYIVHRGKTTFPT